MSHFPHPASERFYIQFSVSFVFPFFCNSTFCKIVLLHSKTKAFIKDAYKAVAGATAREQERYGMRLRPRLSVSSERVLPFGVTIDACVLSSHPLPPPCLASLTLHVQAAAAKHIPLARERTCLIRASPFLTEPFSAPAKGCVCVP